MATAVRIQAGALRGGVASKESTDAARRAVSSDSVDRRGGISVRAWTRPNYIVDRAKADTLWSFDEVQTALNLLYPYESGRKPT